MKTARSLVLLSLLLPAAGPALPQQMADPAFIAKAAHPAYPDAPGPRVLFDEAHHNFHTTGGRYRPFVDLIRSDGYRIVPNQAAFSGDTLAGYDILVIANAMGSAQLTDQESSSPAFTAAECRAVHDWVMGGGALLLIADHAPLGAAAEILARQFGVVMGKGFTYDPEHKDPDSPTASVLVYSRANGLLRDHPITNGRNTAERISRVIAFTGQSLGGPDGSVSFLTLGDAAYDTPDRGEDQPRTPVKGRSQGLAMTRGKGRVVVLGEAAMMTAQIVRQASGDRKMGMNRAGIDNLQFALNIMHWLSGILR